MMVIRIWEALFIFLVSQLGVWGVSSTCNLGHFEIIPLYYSLIQRHLDTGRDGEYECDDDRFATGE